MESILKDKAKKFALDIVALYKSVNYNPLINQLLRSGTSIGANLHEAQYAQTKADFITKLQIALKECYETEYWLDLLISGKMLDDKYKSLLTECLSIKKMLISSCKTAKDNSDLK